MRVNHKQIHTNVVCFIFLEDHKSILCACSTNNLFYSDHKCSLTLETVVNGMLNKKSNFDNNKSRHDF